MWVARGIKPRGGVVIRTRLSLPRRAEGEEPKAQPQGGAGWKKKEAAQENAPKESDDIDVLADSIKLGTVDVKPNYSKEQLEKQKDIDIRIKKWMEDKKAEARGEWTKKKDRMRTAFDKLPPRFKAAAQKIDFKMALVPSNMHLPTFDPPKYYPYPPDETDIFEEEELEEKEARIRAQKRGKRVKLSAEALKRLKRHKAKRGGKQGPPGRGGNE